MKIAVCVKAVPDAAAGRRLDPGTKRLDRSGELTISDWDTYPIEEALALKERAGDGEVVVVSMGPERALDALRKALATGAAAGSRGSRRLDQHAALPVVEGDHGGEEEAAGDGRRG